jgi:hypothetical protein
MDIFNSQWFTGKYNGQWVIDIDEHLPYDGVREYWRKCYIDKTERDSVFHVIWRYSSDEEALRDHHAKKDAHGETRMKEFPHVEAMIPVPNVPANLRNLPHVYVFRGPSVPIRNLFKNVLNVMDSMDQVIVLFCKGRFIHKLFISVVNSAKSRRDPLAIAEDAARAILK